MKNELRVHKWKLPKLGKLKCNVDATCFASVGCLGFRVVICDDEGCFVFALSGYYQGVLSSKMAEAMGLHVVLQWLLEDYSSNVEIEFDLLEVVHAMNSFDEGLIEFGVVIKDCQYFLARGQGFSLFWIRR
ncbi:hypothetical protein P3X46_002658 [Hevea brasiliensis]|uniref:RNase H type-1 domain-containing protein n=1 Tax=Hevea brasiliensis TaxID=3981 RepID=A0ABQ9N3N6_HEVBR|nr:hypothetical protein P3X46_002658 [Hevea brasiliensis]